MKILESQMKILGLSIKMLGQRWKPGGLRLKGVSNSSPRLRSVEYQVVLLSDEKYE